MEGLHFQSESEAFKSPTPLLLVATLYVSALHHPSDELAALAPEYFQATCGAIAELSVPEGLTRPGTASIDSLTPPLAAEQKAFQNVLGLILAGLVSEAFVHLTGIWIAIGYRLVLDHCPVYIDESANKWRQLFSGLQVKSPPRTSLSEVMLTLSRSLTLSMLRFISLARSCPYRHPYLRFASCRVSLRILSIDSRYTCAPTLCQFR
jgi:hypothetical protein